MSTAATVPETHGLEGDDAIQTLRGTGAWPLVRDSYIRFRYADGFTHARALAFQFVLTLIPALIAVVALATLLGQNEFSRILTQTIEGIAPGPAGEVLTTALGQGTERGREEAETAVIIGLLVASVSAATAMGQVERGANRIYGVERDRPAIRKYAIASGLALSAGLAVMLAFVALVPGAALGDSLQKELGWDDALNSAWSIGRWPLAAVLVGAAVALVFRISPRRSQPAFSWLAFGAAVTVILWFAFTGALAAYVSLSEGFGDTYGPMAGLIGLLLWSFLSALALYLGLAIAAQLEAIRAGAPGPRDDPSPAPRAAAAPASV